MKVYRYTELTAQERESLCRRNPIAHPSVLGICEEIFTAVETRGDEAVRDYTRRFDKVEPKSLEVTAREFQQALSSVPLSARQALEHAAANIRRFHEAQLVTEPPLEVEPGIRCWRESRPISSVGLYVPGGTAVLPSTVLMLAVPARLAGCPLVVACVPPRPDGSVSAEVLVAAQLAGVERVFKVGGAQAVAAMAVGTESVPRVDKILGPGNRWVQAAKLLAVLRGRAIDMVAGPSEVLVIADASARPEWVASDLIAQAEHDSESQVVLVSDSSGLIRSVLEALPRQLQDLPRREIAAEALRHSFVLHTEDLSQAVAFADSYAPEHLILQVEEAEKLAGRIRSAGSVFLGPWSPEVAGDYASGTNHTLPTSGLAAAFSGVSVDTFVKKITFQQLSQQGLRRLAPTLERLAQMEELEGHRRAVAVRLAELQA